ncbi:MAG: VOC family protein [Thermomicrobiales bacterium]
MEPIYTILYVADIPKSVAFYRDLFGKDPVEDHPGFALFVLENGTAWGLWRRSDVIPAATGEPGAAEYCFAIESRGALDALATEWKGRGIPVPQEPVDRDFGYTFTALDPDGHRLRPFVPAPRTAAARA